MQIIKEGLNFGQALQALTDGKKVKRAIWDGFWFLEKEVLAYNETCSFHMKDVIYASLRHGQGIVPAQPYQQDLLSEDWQEVDPFRE